MKNYLKKLIQQKTLNRPEIRSSMRLLLKEETPLVQKGAFLSLLAAKGETVSEITEIAKNLERQMVRVRGLKNALDIVGTGGDGYDTINVSTLASFVCAYLGIPVAKHGTRALSSKCGSFDLLQALRVEIPQTPKDAEKAFDKHGIVFLFAPNFHPAFKKIHPVRKDLGIRTVFNFVGPLLNPGQTYYQVVGVSSGKIAKKIGDTLIKLGRKRALVMHSRDGLDEASISAPTDVYDYARGRPMRHLVVRPEKYYAMSAVRGGTPEDNAKRGVAILSGKGTAAENEFVALNAALGLYAFGKVRDVKTGRAEALEAIKSGQVIDILNKLRGNTLERILADKKKDLEVRKKQVPLRELKRKADATKRKIRSFEYAIARPSQVNLIAEIKKASPSLGDINTAVDIHKQAKIYESAGASAISVVTDSHFKGDPSFIKEIKKVTTVPVLQKDFIFEPYQIYESYLAGADALLLIAAIVDEKTLRKLVSLSSKLGIDCLVETHSKEDIDKALQTNARIIGINARDLKTFDVSLDNVINLAKNIPKDRLIVAESGIHTRKDVKYLAQEKINAVLVGTALMKARDVGAKIRELIVNV
ncbi:MAG: anthranilate phosphoribosyltransferase [bacterium]|nr:anthranilate phosphoribosyltransferase [bacterium]